MESKHSALKSGRGVMVGTGHGQGPEGISTLTSRAGGGGGGGDEAGSSVLALRGGVLQSEWWGRSIVVEVSWWERRGRVLVQ
jgi:hypothetical protein